MSSEHPSIGRFREELARLGGTGRIVVLPDSVHTAALAAEALGCEVGAIANSLLFDADGSPVLILTSGAHRVDTAKVADELGVTQLRRAKPDHPLPSNVEFYATGLRSGTLYPLLIRLEAQGLLEAEWQPPAAPGRPPRHAYRLTAAGLARARSGDEAGTDRAGPLVAKRGEAFT